MSMVNLEKAFAEFSTRRHNCTAPYECFVAGWDAALAYVNRPDSLICPKCEGRFVRRQDIDNLQSVWVPCECVASKP